MTRVLVAAPAPALRAGLRAMLAPMEGVQVVGETAMLADLPTTPAGIDVILVGDEALLADVASSLLDDGQVAMVVLADDVRAVEALRALPLAGWGIVSPDATAEELQAAVSAAAQGMVVIPLAAADRLIVPPSPTGVAGDQPAEPLTAREREVLELLGQGLSNKLIARSLGISEHTVKFHVSSIFGKLGASSRTDAISKGARQGLISL